MRRAAPFLLLSSLLVWPLGFEPDLEAATAPTTRGLGGAVSSGHPLATQAGLDILRAGGNAADAAVATALALAVVFPEAGNLGGGGFAVTRFGDQVTSLDFREVAPAAATRTMFLDERGEPRREASLIGPLAAGVPGSPAGLHALHQRLGKLPWPAVVAPAIRLARDGFPISRRLSELLTEESGLLRRFPETEAFWFPDGDAPPPASLLRLPDLAATLEAYAERGPQAISEGQVAQAIEAASRSHGGILTAADLAAYEPVWREPVRFRAFGWELASMALPSSGGIVLGQSMGMLERWGWGSLPRFGADRAHLLAEALRRSYADRFYLGDPSTSAAREADLLASPWLDRLAAGIDPREATPSEDVVAWGAVHGAPSAARATGGSGDTTHLAAVDDQGNVVSLTTTLNGLFGCGLYVPGAGFFLNNEMDDFAAAPGRPNLYGLIQGEANAVRPGKRMLSSMSPTVAWRDGQVLAVGGRGGSRIPTNTLQVLLNVLVDGDGLQEAISRPRLHHQWLPDVLLAEADALAPETRRELERRGHRIAEPPGMAKIHAVRRLPDGTVEAAAEVRGAGAPGVAEPLPGGLPLERQRGVPTPVSLPDRGEATPSPPSP